MIGFIFFFFFFSIPTAVNKKNQFHYTYKDGDSTLATVYVQSLLVKVMDTIERGVLREPDLEAAGIANIRGENHEMKALDPEKNTVTAGGMSGSRRRTPLLNT